MRPFILFLAAACVVFAQAEPQVISVTASRQLNVQSDQVSINMILFSDPDKTLDDVLTFLQAAKISAADLTNFYTTALAGKPKLQWSFTRTVSFPDLGTIAAALAALPTLTDGPLTLWYFTLNATASPQALAANPCPYPSLINDAQTQAGKLAAAAGVTLGPIVSMEEPNTGTLMVRDPFASVLNPYAYVVYDPNTTSVATIGSGQPCSVTVDFKLGQ